MKVGFTTIEVQNLEESINFYTNVLSLKEVKRFSPSPAMQMVFLKGNNDGVIQLMKTNTSDYSATSCGALKAVGIQVDNLTELAPMLKEKGVKFLGELRETPGNIKILFIEDPNGVRIELIEGFEI
jgi:lactoylglutathione lyase